MLLFTDLNIFLKIIQVNKLLIKTLGLRLNILSFLAPSRVGEAAFWLFGKPPKASVRPKERAFLDTSKSELVDAYEHKYVEYVWGKAHQPYIFCAYGWAYNAGRWRHFVPALQAAGYRVIAFDPPGHGDCPGDHANLVINSQIIEQIIRTYGKPFGIIGHSFGGSSALVALRNLEKELHPDRMAVMASFSMAKPIFLDFCTTLGLRKSVFERMVAHADKLLGYPLDDLDFAKMSASMPHIKSLIIHDPEDKVTPFLHAERFHKAWAGSKLVSAVGGGHHLGKDQYTEIVLEHMIQKVPIF
jgi:pimeloyl-ACP methyl ester carboxylesterase